MAFNPILDEWGYVPRLAARIPRIGYKLGRVRVSDAGQKTPHHEQVRMDMGIDVC